MSISREQASPAQVGIVGFCMGGSVTFLRAARHALGAAASFYGGGITAGRFCIPPLINLAPELKTPWIGFFGDRDQPIPTDQVEALRAAAKNAPVPTEVERYAEAEHGFHCDASGSYHEASAKDASKRTIDWFANHVKAHDPRRTPSPVAGWSPKTSHAGLPGSSTTTCPQPRVLRHAA